jgi:hypothetical protein
MQPGQQRVEVRLGEHLLRLLDGDREVERHTVGVGAAATPTPQGTWYVVSKERGPTGGLAEGPILELTSGMCLRATGRPEGLGGNLSGG